MDKLIESCIENAKALFLELDGEFYPLNNESEIVPYNIIFEDDFPESLTVIKSLATSLVKDIENGKYKEVAICSLATKKADNYVYYFLDIKTMNNQNQTKDYAIVIDADYKNHTFTILEEMDFVGTIKAFIE